VKQKRILIYGETDGVGLSAVTRELIGKSRALAAKSGLEYSLILIHDQAENCRDELSAYGLSRIYIWKDAGDFRADRYADLLADTIRREDPDILLVGGSPEGRSLAPRVAAIFRTGITADCTELALDTENRLIQTRPAFGGNIMAHILTPNRRPQIATVRPGVMPPADRTEYCPSPEWILCRNTARTSAIRLLGIEPADAAEEIDTCSLLLAVGGGLKDKEDLEMFRELAALLGAGLAGSRVLVERGFLPPEAQIGLSGHSVRPRKLITFGISGSLQFRAGIRQAQKILAVNIDPEAEIFRAAHTAICGDLYEIVPELIGQLKEK
jgi:electron transfer flavoprotein alpha subunit